MKHTTRTVIGAFGAGALLAAGVGVGVWKLDPAWSSSKPKATAGISTASSTSKTVPSTSSTRATPTVVSSADVEPVITDHSAGVMRQDDPLLPPNAFIPEEPVAPESTTTPTTTETTTPSAPVPESEVPLISEAPSVELDLTEKPSTPPEGILDSWNSWAQAMGLTG
ncbi:hypothetical protein [Corynebacterium gerontici]|nr:hypothetical protein [Corynebacterium gerontici]